MNRERSSIIHNLSKLEHPPGKVIVVGKILGLGVLDHNFVTKGCFFSSKDKGLMWYEEE